MGGFEIGDGLELDGITLKSNGGDNLISYPKENGNYYIHGSGLSRGDLWEFKTQTIRLQTTEIGKGTWSYDNGGIGNLRNDIVNPTITITIMDVNGAITANAGRFQTSIFANQVPFDGTEINYLSLVAIYEDMQHRKFVLVKIYPDGSYAYEDFIK